ncbi:MAG: MFS transporter [Bacteroidia bacterium]|nr:MFS transporter [Bacteroidia bacterium]
MEETAQIIKPAKAEKIKFTPYQISVIVLLALTQFTVVLDFMVMSPLGDMLMKSMSLTTGQFGMVVSAYAFSAGISGLLTAGFADMFDRKKLLMVFYVGFILGTLFCGLSTNYPMLIAARIITGIFGGVIGSISMAIVADIFVLQQRGRVMGFMQMGFGISQVLGIPISLYLANVWDWKAPFLMIVGLATIIWILIMIKLEPINKHLDVKNDRNALSHLWHTIKQRHYRIGFFATALLSLGGFMMMPWGSAFAVNNLHVTPEQLPLLFMVAGVSTLFIMPIVGKLSDKMDKNILFAIASIWMILVVLIYTNLTPVPLWVIMIFNIAMMIGIMSRMVPSMALVTALPEMHDRGAFMSINSSLQQIAGGVAAGVGGLIVVQKDKFSPLEHYNTLGIVISILSLIGIYAVYRVSTTVKSREAAKAN